MRKLFGTIAFLTVGAGALTASAAPAPGINGSDTLEELTTKLVTTNCAGVPVSGIFTSSAGALTYAGGGSGTGESAMLNSALGQVVAPMSRALTATACGTAHNGAQGIVHSLDAIAVTVDSQESQTCGNGHAARTESGVTGTGTIPTASVATTSGNPPVYARIADTVSLAGGVSITSWQQTLKLLYLGIAPDNSKDCNSAARNDLAANYSKFFQGGCTGTDCAEIKHAFRRGDTSGTTDTFLSLLSAPAITTTPFCNGTEKDDLDPIRHTCSQVEQVCEADGKLGLVLPVVVPTGTQDKSILYNANVNANTGTQGAQPPTCTTNAPGYGTGTGPLRCDCRYPIPGQVATGGAAAGTEFTWNLRFANKCFTAVSTQGGTRYGVLGGDDGIRDNSPTVWGAKSTGHPETGKQRCCTPPGSTAFATQDPRTLNLWVRDPGTGNYSPAGSNVNPVAAYYRIYSNDRGRSAVAISGAGTAPKPFCQHDDATTEIGCLTQIQLPAIAAAAPLPAEPSRNCNVGYAGYAAVDADATATNPPAHGEPVALWIGTGTRTPVGPSVASVQDLVANPAAAYPFSRKLFLFAIDGFTALQNGLPNAPSGFTPGPDSFVSAANNGGVALSFGYAQYNLAKCYADRVRVAQPAGTSPEDTAGFFTLPAFAGNGNVAAQPALCNNACTTNIGCGTLTPIGTLFDSK